MKKVVGRAEGKLVLISKNMEIIDTKGKMSDIIKKNLITELPAVTATIKDDTLFIHLTRNGSIIEGSRGIEARKHFDDTITAIEVTEHGRKETCALQHDVAIVLQSLEALIDSINTISDLYNSGSTIPSDELIRGAFDEIGDNPFKSPIPESEIHTTLKTFFNTLNEEQFISVFGTFFKLQAWVSVDSTNTRDVTINNTICDVDVNAVSEDSAEASVEVMGEVLEYMTGDSNSIKGSVKVYGPTGEVNEVYLITKSDIESKLGDLHTTFMTPYLDACIGASPRIMSLVGEWQVRVNTSNRMFSGGIVPNNVSFAHGITPLFNDVFAIYDDEEGMSLRELLEAMFSEFGIYSIQLGPEYDEKVSFEELTDYVCNMSLGLRGDVNAEQEQVNLPVLMTHTGLSLNTLIKTPLVSRYSLPYSSPYDIYIMSNNRICVEITTYTGDTSGILDEGSVMSNILSKYNLPKEVLSGLRADVEWCEEVNEEELLTSLSVPIDVLKPLGPQQTRYIIEVLCRVMTRYHDYYMNS